MERRLGKNTFTQTGSRLENLYNDLPPVSCTSCGKCCSSPHITFAEAIHLFSSLFETREKVELENLFNAESVSQAYEFSLKCRFENSVSKKCEAHQARGFICRVYGYPVLDRMGIDGMDNCREENRPVVPNVRLYRMRGWMNELSELNHIHSGDFNRFPYHVTGLNIETWLDIAVTDYGRAPFRLYHEGLNFFPFQTLNLSFSDRTALSARLAKIDLFFQTRGRGDAAHSKKILENLIHSEPQTGTFFRYEAKRYLSVLDSPPHSA